MCCASYITETRCRLVEFLQLCFCSFHASSTGEMMFFLCLCLCLLHFGAQLCFLVLMLALISPLSILAFSCGYTCTSLQMSTRLKYTTTTNFIKIGLIITVPYTQRIIIPFVKASLDN